MPTTMPIWMPNRRSLSLSPVGSGWAAIAAGLNAAFRAFGLPEWSLAEVKGRVRRSLRESFPEIFGPDWETAREIFYAEVRARHLAVLTPITS